MKKGSITIFAVFCMLSVMSAVFLLLEAARYYGLEWYTDQKSRQCVEYVAAEYQPYLWDKFHILLLDGAYGTENFESGKLAGRIQKAAGKNRNSGFLDAEMNRIYTPEYTLATDLDGEVFLAMIAAYQKQLLLTGEVQKLYKICEEQDAIKDNGIEVDAQIEQAKEELEQAKNKLQEEGQQPPVIENNPLETGNELKNALKYSVLDWLLPEGTRLSGLQMNLSENIENRTLEEGTRTIVTGESLDERILVLKYAEEVFSCYGKEKQDHLYAYELEYLVAGKEKECENLEIVVKKMLRNRLAANVTHILSDPEKMEEAWATARSIAGCTGNPWIIMGVKSALVGSWAYAESILDMRSLLSGEKIPLIKSKEQWTLGLFELQKAFQRDVRAKVCENGNSYETYISQMLFFSEKRELAYRMMNVMEQHLKMTEQYANCQMDHMLVSFGCEMEFASEPFFSELSFLDSHKTKKYYWKKKEEFSYIP